MRTGIAHLPLHGGKAPHWLFDRMKKLARQVSLVIIEDFGSSEMLRKLSDPYWFQAFGCVLGFDWHSSGLTTTVGGALKEGLSDIEEEIGLFVAGGKGGRWRKTPREIEISCEKIAVDPKPLIYASRMSAKVDSAALQDGYQLYHHNFFFTSKGEWCVVQQGMNDETKYARRYHWLSESMKEFVNEPHSAVCSENKGSVLNMVAEESRGSRKASTQIAREHPDKFFREKTLFDQLELPYRHDIRLAEDVQPRNLRKVLLSTYEKQPDDFKKLLGIEGVGPKTIRALSLMAELIYGEKPSFRDPARFSFAHGGKDGIPYPVDRKLYDKSVQVLSRCVSRSGLDHSEKKSALRRLADYNVQRSF